MKTPRMNSWLALFLQVLIVLLGIVVLGLMLVEPHFEGRNVHATTFEIYCRDPFLAYVYTGSIPFFVALYRAFELFGLVRREGTFSLATLRTLRAIKGCAITLLGFVAGAVVLILLFGDGEDRPAGVFMSALVALAASVIAAAAALLSRKLQSVLAPAEERQA